MTWGALRLKRLFASATGGSWGCEPGEGDVVLPCVRGTDFDYGRLRVDLSRAPMRGFTLTDVAYRSATSGDLIIEKSGGGEQQPVGRVVRYDGADPVMPTNFAGRLRPGNRTESRFASYLLASLYTDGRTRAAIKQTTGIQNLDVDSLLNNMVVVPSKPEQSAIADFLDRETARIDALIDAKRRVVELLHERLKLTIIEATRRGLDPTVQTKESGLSWVGQIPDHWRIVPNRAVLELRRSIVGSSSSAFTLLSLTRRGVIIRDISDNYGKFPASFDGYQEAIPGDLIFCLFDIPETTRTVGQAKLRGMVTGAYTVFRARQLALPSFLEYLYQGYDDEKSLSLFYTGLRKVIRTDTFMGIRCPLPPRAEQEAIVKHLDLLKASTDSLATTLSRQIDLLVEHRQALITAAVTGGLEIPRVAA